MSKLSRITAKIFGSGASANTIGQFGSLANGTPAYATDPATAQSLANWLTGWYGAVVGNNSPAIEDMNAFCFVVAYQIAYSMQAGIPEWDSGTTYYTGSLAMSSGFVYVSLADNNLNNAVTDTAHWGSFQLQNGSVTTNQIAAHTITGSNIAPSTITGGNIATGTITNTNLAPVNMVISSTSGAFITSSTTPAGVVSVSITTTGKPVMVMLNSDFSGNPASIGALSVSGAPSTAYMLMTWTRNGTTVNVSEFNYQGPNGVTLTQAATGIGFTDFTIVNAPGTYTYEVLLSVSTVSWNAILNYSAIVAYEL